LFKNNNNNNNNNNKLPSLQSSQTAQPQQAVTQHSTAVIGLIICHAGQQREGQKRPSCNKGITQFYLPNTHGMSVLPSCKATALSPVPSYTVWHRGTQV